MRFLSDEQLTTEKGIPGSDVTMWRRRRDSKLPRARKFGPRLRATPEPLIDKYLELIAIGHSEEEATSLAEKYLARVLAKKSEASS